MSFNLSRPGNTEPADNEPAETDPATETKPVADTPPVAETEPVAETGVPTTVEVPAPRDADTSGTSDGDTTYQDASDTALAGNATDDALSTSSDQGTDDASPAASGRPQPSFQPRVSAEPVSTPAFTGPPADNSLEGPLLPDAPQLRENWQRILASFIDDPRGSVAEAAALVDHAAQALAGALQQRQRRLRESWDTADRTARSSPLDTEELRVAMQRYQTMFSHICRP